MEYRYVTKLRSELLKTALTLDDPQTLTALRVVQALSTAQGVEVYPSKAVQLHAAIGNLEDWQIEKALDYMNALIAEESKRMDDWAKSFGHPNPPNPPTPPSTATQLRNEAAQLNERQARMALSFIQALNVKNGGQPNPTNKDSAATEEESLIFDYDDEDGENEKSSHNTSAGASKDPIQPSKISVSASNRSRRLYHKFRMKARKAADSRTPTIVWDDSL